MLSEAALRLSLRLPFLRNTIASYSYHTLKSFCVFALRSCFRWASSWQWLSGRGLLKEAHCWGIWYWFEGTFHSKTIIALPSLFYLWDSLRSFTFSFFLSFLFSVPLSLRFDSFSESPSCSTFTCRHCLWQLTWMTNSILFSVPQRIQSNSETVKKHDICSILSFDKCYVEKSRKIER
jgi:hypothetical protein